MAPIVVDPEVLTGAGVSVSSVGDEIAAAVNTLAGALPNGAMAGHDRAGLAFGQAYQQGAQALMEAAGAAVGGGRKVGFGVQMSATNYSRAEASSTIGGAGAPLMPPSAPGEFDAPSVPSPFGGGVAEPFLWSMVEMFVGDVWPNGDPAQLRAAGTAWSTFARSMAGIGAQLEGPSSTIAGQQIPEGGAMTQALSDLKQGLAEICTESAKLGVQLFEFATDVESAQNAIRDLLGRLSPSGIFDTLGSIFSGDAMEELREIADDIRAVLDNLGRQANARQHSIQDVMQLIDGAVLSLQKNARREFVDFFGEDVGNPLATALDILTNQGQGILEVGLENIEGIQQLDPFRFAYDFEGAKEAWGALGETAFYANPMTAMLDPIGAFEHGKGMAEGFVHADDWSTERPGLGPAKFATEIGSMLIPGVGATKATRAASLADDVAEGAGPGVRSPNMPGNPVSELGTVAERAENISGELDNIGDNIMPNATPDAPGPAIPKNVVDTPSTSNVPESPEAPRVADSPAPHVPDSPTVHVPDSPPVDRFSTAPHSPVDPSPDSHSPTPTSNPAHAPAGAVPESRVPAEVEAPFAPHQDAPFPPPGSAPSGAAPATASSHALDTAPVQSDVPQTPPASGNAQTSIFPVTETPSPRGMDGSDGGNSEHESTQASETPTHTESPNEPHSGDDARHSEDTSDNKPESIPPEDIAPLLVRDTPYETGGLQPQYAGEQYPGGPMGSPGVTYLDDVAREEYRITIRDGLVYDADGMPFDTGDGVSAFANSGGRAIFVMDEHGNLYASTYQAFREFHHSSLLAGGDVAAAGEIVVKDGKIELVTDRSGHYMPGRSRTQQFLDQLASQSIDLDPNNIHFFAPPET